MPAADAATPCATPPVAVRDLALTRPYTDAIGSDSDVATRAQHEQEAAPLKSWLQAVTKSADGGAADCALRWLATWARDGALLGVMQSKQAEYERKWTMSGAALAYLKVRHAAGAETRSLIEPWLGELATRVTAFQSAPERKRNNHRYWLGLGLGAVALATDRRELWRQAREIFADAARDVAADGTLPLELARGRRALHYHAFSVMALVTLAELAALRGEDWYDANDGALHRLVAVTLRGLSDPSLFDRLAGVPQERPVNPGAGWVALYATRFPDRITSPLPAASPGHRWLGGDVRHLATHLARP